MSLRHLKLLSVTNPDWAQVSFIFKQSVQKRSGCQSEYLSVKCQNAAYYINYVQQKTVQAVLSLLFPMGYLKKEVLKIKASTSQLSTELNKCYVHVQLIELHLFFFSFCNFLQWWPPSFRAGWSGWVQVIIFQVVWWGWLSSLHSLPLHSSVLEPDFNLGWENTWILLNYKYTKNIKEYSIQFSFI